MRFWKSPTVITTSSIFASTCDGSTEREPGAAWLWLPTRSQAACSRAPAASSASEKEHRPDRGEARARRGGVPACAVHPPARRLPEDGGGAGDRPGGAGAAGGGSRGGGVAGAGASRDGAGGAALRSQHRSGGGRGAGGAALRDERE